MRRVARNPEVVIVQNPALPFSHSSKGRGHMRRKRRSRRNSHRKHRVSHRRARYNRKRHSRRNKGRGRRKVSAYARFVGTKMRAGHSMKAAARMWKSH